MLDIISLREEIFITFKRPKQFQTYINIHPRQREATCAHNVIERTLQNVC